MPGAPITISLSRFTLIFINSFRITYRYWLFNMLLRRQLWYIIDISMPLAKGASSYLCKKPLISPAFVSRFITLRDFVSIVIVSVASQHFYTLARLSLSTSIFSILSFSSFDFAAYSSVTAVLSYFIAFTPHFARRFAAVASLAFASWLIADYFLAALSPIASDAELYCFLIIARLVGFTLCYFRQCFRCCVFPLISLHASLSLVWYKYFSNIISILLSFLCLLSPAVGIRDALYCLKHIHFVFLFSLLMIGHGRCCFHSPVKMHFQVIVRHILSIFFASLQSRQRAFISCHVSFSLSHNAFSLLHMEPQPLRLLQTFPLTFCGRADLFGVYDVFFDIYDTSAERRVLLAMRAATLYYLVFSWCFRCFASLLHARYRSPLPHISITLHADSFFACLLQLSLAVKSIFDCLYHIYCFTTAFLPFFHIDDMASRSSSYYAWWRSCFLLQFLSMLHRLPLPSHRRHILGL